MRKRGRKEKKIQKVSVKSVPTFIICRSYSSTHVGACVYFSHIYLAITLNMSVCECATTRPLAFYAAENKVHGLSRRCRDHCRRSKHTPPFFRRSCE